MHQKTTPQPSNPLSVHVSGPVATSIWISLLPVLHIQQHQPVFHVFEEYQQNPSAQDSRSRFVKAAKGQEFGSLKMHLLWGRVGYGTTEAVVPQASVSRQVPPYLVLSACHTHAQSQRGRCHCPTDSLCCVAFCFLTLSKSFSRLTPKLTLNFHSDSEQTPPGHGKVPSEAHPTPQLLPLACPSTRGPSGLLHFTH